ncbi:hypothetical protein PGT21_001650 [Puccinia graminis f. sp. tritici]|uniref:Uncharacterized protein n=1 Tax=Puccinia graminis f. sp. tritici TaxID=56615 RepID=A0A5B0PWM8_PUCGR|nr:hypothetical protein PGT21_001650 [Puccinia graminis f. sp. tritici]
MSFSFRGTHYRVYTAGRIEEIPTAVPAPRPEGRPHDAPGRQRDPGLHVPVAIDGVELGSTSLCHGDDTDRGAMRPRASGTVYGWGGVILATRVQGRSSRFFPLE